MHASFRIINQSRYTLQNFRSRWINNKARNNNYIIMRLFVLFCFLISDLPLQCATWRPIMATRFQQLTRSVMRIKTATFNTNESLRCAYIASVDMTIGCLFCQTSWLYVHVVCGRFAFPCQRRATDALLTCRYRTVSSLLWLIEHRVAQWQRFVSKRGAPRTSSTIYVNT